MGFRLTENGEKTVYGKVAYVYDEYLYEYKSSRPTMIFERSNVTEYKFTTAF